MKSGKVKYFKYTDEDKIKADALKKKVAAAKKKKPKAKKKK